MWTLRSGKSMCGVRLAAGERQLRKRKSACACVRCPITCTPRFATIGRWLTIRHQMTTFSHPAPAERRIRTIRIALQKVLRETLKITLPPGEDCLHLLRHTSGSLVFGATGSVKEAQA